MTLDTQSLPIEEQASPGRCDPHGDQGPGPDDDDKPHHHTHPTDRGDTEPDQRNATSGPE